MMVAVLATAGCTKKVPSEQLIADFAKHYDKVGDRYTRQLSGMDAEKRNGFITLQLSNEIKAQDLWYIESDGDAVIVAELKSREKEPKVSMISACLDDAAACGAVLDVLDAFRQNKIRPALALRAVFYYGGETGTDGLKAVCEDFLRAGEMAAFDIEVSSRDTLPERTFIIEDKPLFAEKVVEVVPQYLAPVCDVQFQTGDYPRQGWPSSFPTYRYRLGSDRLADLKALTAFTFLLN